MSEWKPPPGAVPVEESSNWTPPAGAVLVDEPAQPAEPVAIEPQQPIFPLPFATAPPARGGSASTSAAGPSTSFSEPSVAGLTLAEPKKEVPAWAASMPPAPEPAPVERPRVFRGGEGAWVIRPDGTQQDVRDQRIEEDFAQRAPTLRTLGLPAGQYTPEREAAMREAGTWGANDELNKRLAMYDVQARSLRERATAFEDRLKKEEATGLAEKARGLEVMRDNIGIVAGELQRLDDARKQNQSIDLNAYADLSIRYDQASQQYEEARKAYNAIAQPLNEEREDIDAGFAYLKQRTVEALKAHAEDPSVKMSRANQAILDERFDAAQEEVRKGNYLAPKVIDQYVIRPISTAVTKSVADAAGAILRGLDTYGNLPNTASGKDYYSLFAEAADKLTDAAEDITASPSQTQKPLFDANWDVNTEALLPKVMQAATTMAVLGGAGAVGGEAGMVAASYMTTEEDYYREAIRSGLSPTQAQTFSMGAAALTSLLEKVNPGPLVDRGTIKGAMAERALTALREGKDMRAAMRDATSYILRQGAGEGSQEILQGLGDVAARNVTNALIGDEKLDGSVDLRDLAEQGLLGAALGSIAATGGRMADRPLHQQALDWAVRNKEKVETYINESAYTDKAELLKNLDALDALYRGNRLDQLEPKKSAQVAAILQQKQEKEEEIRKAPMDETVRAALGDPREQEVQALAREALTNLGVPQAQADAALVESGAEEAPTKEPPAPASPEPEVQRIEPTLTRDVDDEPRNLASAYLDDLYQYHDEGNVESVLAGLTKGNVRTESYYEHGDRNNVADGFAKQFLRKGGEPLDMIAMQASEITGRTVTEQDVVDFMHNNPGGRPLRSERMAELADRYKAITGKKLDKRIARSLLKKMVNDPLGRAAVVYDVDEQAVLDGHQAAEAEWDAMTPAQQAAFWTEREEAINSISDEEGDVQPEGSEATQGSDRVPGSQARARADGYRAEAERRAGDEERELESRVAFDRRALDKATADFNQRGQALFAEDEGTNAPGMFGDMRQNEHADFDRIAAPLRAQLEQSQATLDTFRSQRDARVDEIATALAAQTELDDAPSFAGSAAEARSGRTADPFTLPDEQLGRYFDRRFVRTGGAARGNYGGRNAKYIFRDQPHFNTWMDERYAERDLDGMREAFAEAPSPMKVKYVRHVQHSGTAHQKAWIAHIATGAPLPVKDPPIQRTTPRPMPQGGTDTSKPPSTPAPPTDDGFPFPRPANTRPRLDLTAMVQLMAEFNKTPSINKRLRRAFGRYVTGREDIELMERLMWDTKLAERVLGHEMGHLVDLMLETKGDGKGFAERIAPLKDFKKAVGARKELRNAAKALSRAWRGPFNDGDPYRDSAEELFADVMSALFNDPDLVNERYPVLYDAFGDLMDGKPAFAEAYKVLTDRITGKGVAQEWRRKQKQNRAQSIQEATADKSKNKASFKDSMEGLFRSPWFRIRDIQGTKISRDLGRTMQDDLEISNLFAMRANAFFESDFREHVVPLLKQIADDPNVAMEHLHEYIQANRTINERRAAGLWIESNPQEARKMLTELVRGEPYLTKYSGDVASAPPDALYDLAAQVFREVHQQGEKIVDRVVRKIDKMDLGIGGDAALMAFNVRGKLLNPEGLTVERAREVIAEQREELGPERFAALEGAQRELSNLLYDVQRKAHNEGLISDRAFNEVVVPNRDNYAPYAVLDYWGGRVGAGMAQQMGTAKGIADTVLATQLKVASLNSWRQRQHQVATLVKAYERAGLTVQTDTPLERPSDIESVRSKHREDATSRAVLYKDGAPFVAEFPNDPGKTFEEALDQENLYQSLQWIAKASGAIQASMQLFTTLSPNFWFRNMQRGLRTSVNRLGIRNTGKTFFTPTQQKEAMRLAWNYAKAARGDVLDPEVRRMVDKGILMPPRLSRAMAYDAKNQQELMAGGILMAFDLYGRDHESTAWTRSRVKRALDRFTHISSAYEAYEKIMNYRTAKDARKLSEEAAQAVARRAGIPKPGVGGKSRLLNMAIETLFTWSRVSIQGELANYDVLRDPSLGGGYARRVVFTELLPRIAMVAVGAGIVKMLLDDDDDELGAAGVYAEAIRRASPYKMALDTTFPLCFYDPRTGEYHAFSEFISHTEIPAHYETVSARVPSSEEGRVWGPLVYNMLANNTKELGKPGEGTVSSLGNWATETAVPGLNPLLSLGNDLFDMTVRGRNPQDEFTQGPVANPLLFDAGWGEGRGEAIAGAALQRTGGIGDMLGSLLTGTGAVDPRAVKASSRRGESDDQPLAELIPLVKGMVSYDNAVPGREAKLERLESDQAKAAAKLVMPTAAKEMYDFYYHHLKSKDQLDPYDRIRFNAASVFVNDIWGDATSKGDTLNTVQGYRRSDGSLKIVEPTLHGRALWAVSNDASSEARDSLSHDIEQAAAPLLEVFKNPRTILEMSKQRDAP